MLIFKAYSGNMNSHESKVFDKTDFSEKDLSRNEFTLCEFINCNFSKANFTNSTFIDCTFTGCNLSLVVLNNAGIKTVKFVNCKLMGINFSVCNSFLFSVAFTDCILDLSSFFQKNMKKTPFVNCSLKEVQFEEVDLAGALFKNCDLHYAVFTRTILEKADFRTAKNYVIDPEINKMKGAKFSYLGIAGLLYKYNIDIEFN